VRSPTFSSSLGLRVPACSCFGRWGVLTIGYAVGCWGAQTVCGGVGTRNDDDAKLSMNVLVCAQRIKCSYSK
jgi:hypothetical protein